jgi:uncharacterized protein (DUF362 family)
MSSMDPVALDAAASRIMGINPKSVKQIVLAFQEGLGSLNFSPIGDFSYAEKNFPKKKLKDNFRDAIASMYLRIMRKSES